MSKDSWDDRRRASEESYFDKQNQLAMERLKQRTGDKIRRSPVTGEPMKQLTIMGVIIDQCPTTKGIWLDAGELDEIIKNSKQAGDGGRDWVSSFFDGIFGKK